ncbi:unnamed protein product [Phytophthora lilii]|uniref:Unnamed protein product n=1 Tax=Phytophthora lilii TaxID=2077276 RepID=A0A9W6TZP2_9STRA|nr:unnamed protein product [Phytophthora lilii]
MQRDVSNHENFLKSQWQITSFIIGIIVKSTISAPSTVQFKVKNDRRPTQTTMVPTVTKKKVLKALGRSRKRSSTIDTALRALALLQTSAHNVDDSLRRTIIAGIMSKQSHDRERKASYRKQQREVEAVLQHDIQALKNEISVLERRCWNPDTFRKRKATDYIQHFLYFLSNPDLNCAAVTIFLQTNLAPDVMHDAGYGVQRLLLNWRLLSLCFDDIHVEIDDMKTVASNVLVISTTTSVTISEDTLFHAFPHLNCSSGEVTLLAKKLLGQRIDICGSMCFVWGNMSDRNSGLERASIRNIINFTDFHDDLRAPSFGWSEYCGGQFDLTRRADTEPRRFSGAAAAFSGSLEDLYHVFRGAFAPDL